MSFDTSIPGYAELSDWLIPPNYPVRITFFGRFRDGGPQGGTYGVELEDAEGNRIPFFFDRFLGRLCYGNTHETGEDAAFIKVGSKFEKEAFALIESLATSSEEYKEIMQKLEQAKIYSEIAF
jgi:hypothetical protein